MCVLSFSGCSAGTAHEVAQALLPVSSQDTFGAAGLGMSQAEFSRRYAMSPRSLQKWEQGRRRPESAVRAYLTVIDRNPEAVEKALMNKS